MKSETELIELLKLGDRKAFETVFNLHFDGLCLFSASITRNNDVSSDIVEDVFLQLWLNCRINPVTTSIKGYLYRSVYNNSIQHLSRARKDIISLDRNDYRTIEREVFEPLTPEYPIAGLIVRELEEKARKAIDELPEQCRQIYLLNRDEDLKYQEIADKLQLNVGTVKTQMSRAYSKLREALQEFLSILI